MLATHLQVHIEGSFEDTASSFVTVAVAAAAVTGTAFACAFAIAGPADDPLALVVEN